MGRCRSGAGTGCFFGKAAIHDQRTSLEGSAKTKLEPSGSYAGPPFGVADVLEIGSLSAVLTRLVFQHPLVRTLNRRAINVAEAHNFPYEENAGLIVTVYGHDEPLMPLKYFKEDRGESLSFSSMEEHEDYFDQEVPDAIGAFYDAVNLRASTLAGMLQRQEVIARGHTVDGHLVQIAHSIWSHDDYYIHPSMGDVYEAAPTGMTRKWTGVILAAPNAASSTTLLHVKPLSSDGVLPATIEQQSAPRRSKAVARVETMATSRRECFLWLTGTVQASPHERSESIESLWTMAKQKWPGTLSHRAFLDARKEAIRRSGASAWAAAGAPKKSKRLNHRAD